jgi:hypothetical protein
MDGTQEKTRACIDTPGTFRKAVWLEVTPNSAASVHADELDDVIGLPELRARCPEYVIGGAKWAGRPGQSLRLRDLLEVHDRIQGHGVPWIFLLNSGLPDPK